VQLGTGAMQGVRRLGKRLRVENLNEELKDYCCRRAQSRVTSSPRCVEGLPQGVRARGFSL
jgi:hypothetical protein